MGKRIVAIILIVVGLGFLGFGGWRYLQSRKPNAGLKVQTTPESIVFVDDVQIGQTPIDKVFRPGEVGLKVIPNSTDSALTSYQTSVRLSPQVYTVVKRDFGRTDLETAGETVTLEPQAGKQASMSIVTSSPDAASVTLDGQPQGFTPIYIPEVTAGDHEIIVSAPGFQTRSISALAVAGHKLSLNVKLAGVPTIVPTPSPASPSATPKPGTTPTKTPTNSNIEKPYVEIQETPTGWLRVRSGPATNATEIGRVDPGEKYRLLSSVNGWYQIEVDLAATDSGWISSQYADKFE